MLRRRQMYGIRRFQAMTNSHFCRKSKYLIGDRQAVVEFKKTPEAIDQFCALLAHG